MLALSLLLELAACDCCLRFIGGLAGKLLLAEPRSVKFGESLVYSFGEPRWVLSCPRSQSADLGNDR